MRSIYGLKSDATTRFLGFKKPTNNRIVFPRLK